ncbi:MOSC domain-containing protein [Thiohalorhabdus denitrificans]|uniref:MOSC domain-containing protein n=1 Tax=Thiohalorhabdus denitrificans TaxID=381306 RepID=UPI0037DC2EC4
MAPQAGAPMHRVDKVEVGGSGLAGDRYATGQGYWRATDACPVTLIRAEDLERIQRRTGLSLGLGEHRRNLVVRGLRGRDLEAGRLRIGTALFALQGARPPCGHLEQLTEPGMARALRGHSGVCLGVLQPGEIGPGDVVKVEG